MGNVLQKLPLRLQKRLNAAGHFIKCTAQCSYFILTLRLEPACQITPAKALDCAPQHFERRDQMYGEKIVEHADYCHNEQKVSA